MKGINLVLIFYHILSIGVIFMPSSFYANYLFISSTPLGAKVYVITDTQEEDNSSRLTILGETPLKITNFSQSVKIVVEKAGYFSLTNTIPQSDDVQNHIFNLVPFSFEVEFPDQANSFLYVNGETYTSLDGVLSLPYGHYNISHNVRENVLDVNYKSPYIPYVAFFSTITITSVILAITGGILANKYFKEFSQASNEDELLSSLGKVSTWDTVTWASVGIGTGALIGTIVASSLEVRDQKRIKRFNGMNVSSKATDYLTDFQEIILLSSFNSPDTLEKINTFIKKYPKNESHLLPDIYIKRAHTYLLQGGRYNKAIADLKTVINDFPTKTTYEMASKLLGDIYFERQDYTEAYEYYTEALKTQEMYPYDELKMLSLESLYNSALNNRRRYNELFLEETNRENLTKLSAEQRKKIDMWVDTLKENN